MDKHPDPFLYSSRKSVTSTLSVNGQANALGQEESAAQGKLNISFAKEGAIYLAAGLHTITND